MSQKYENTRYFVFRVLDRVGSASSRQIIGMMIASGAGYYAPTTICLAGKMRTWGYLLDRRGRVSSWYIGPKVKTPERRPRGLASFEEWLDLNHPLNN